MTHLRLSNVAAIAFCLALFFIHLPFSIGQNISAAPELENTVEPEPTEPFKVSVNVSEIRLDVVVVDKRGNPITDLTVADFEVYQDDKRQNVTASVYVDSSADAATQPSVSRKDSHKLSLLPSTSLKREDVRRTIVFVLHDLAMSFEDRYYAKMALRNFVEKQMQPGDLISILHTGYGNSTLQMFLSDKRELLARIDNMRLEMTSGFSDEHIDIRSNGNELPTLLSYNFRALKDMPGRKFLIMMAPVRPMLSPLNDTYNSFDEQANRLADEALRAGIVVHHLDIGGLSNFSSNYADASVWQSSTWNNQTGTIEGVLARLQQQRKEPRFQITLNPLPAKTGGNLVMNSNFFLDGIGKETENLMKGYYLISYSPPASTFEPNRKEIYHRIKVRVKRKGATVHTRDGFYNQLDSETDNDAPKNPLVAAIISPFQHADLNINMAAGYVKDAKAGYLVRSWIHLDPKDVKIVETEDGGARIDLETVCLTSDSNGNIQDFRHVTYTFDIKPEKKSENLAWIQKHGIRFSLLLPVKKPGSYYVRVAVHDTEADKVGSAYQFVEIPDLGKKGIALSNIFMITSADDLEWMRSDVTRELNEGAFSLVFQEEEVPSPALRMYAPGDKLQTLTLLYNADANTVARSEMETESILYRDGKEFWRGESEAVDPESGGSPDGILVLKRFTMGSALTPGDYVLQLLATDKKNSKKKEGVAAQTISFTVAKE